MRPSSCWTFLFALASCAALAGCGSSNAPPSGGFDASSSDDSPARDTGPRGGADGGSQNDDTFTAEEEEFLVRSLASTGDYVFVPDSGEDSTTVARIDGRDLSIVPIRVARNPVAVRATDVVNVGSVAYVLCERDSTVAIIRAEKIDRNSDSERHVELLSVPEEVNSIALSPDGRHLLAYIDPEKPLPTGASVASLQVASLVRLGTGRDPDEAFELTLSRFIDEVVFTADGTEAFVVGRDGINRIVLDEVDEDQFVTTLDLNLAGSAFPPEDREVEVAPSGDFLIVRSSQFEGIALHRPPEPNSDSDGETVRVPLPEAPTDIDLRAPDGANSRVVASLPETSQIAVVDVGAAFDDAGSSGVELVEVRGPRPGLAQVTPDGTEALLYTTNALTPEMGVLHFDRRSVRSFELRNQIRSVSTTPNGRNAIVVHRKQDGEPPPGASALELFQHRFGLTLVDLASSYTRPVALRGQPASLVMTTDSEDTPHVFAMLQSGESGEQGLARIDLSTFRTEFLELPRAPQNMGRVAGKIFVSQRSETGRITFVDVDSGERQTVSGYELNAGID